MRHSLALALSLFAALAGFSPQLAQAEAMDPGSSWAPPADRLRGEDRERYSEPEEPQTDQGASRRPGNGDDSVSMGRRSSPPSLSPSSQVQQKPKVAVVILHQVLGKAFDMSVITRIMEPLVPHAAFVPLPVVNKAVRSTGLPPQLLHLPKNLQRLGQKVDADYTLVVEAVGRGRNSGVFVGLVDVHTGETTVAKRVPMPTRALTNSQALILVDLIVSALPAVGPEPGPISQPEASPQGSATPEGHDEAEEHLDEVAEHDAAGAATAADANGLSGPRMARILVGLALDQRVAHLIDTQNSGITPPQYAGSGNNTNPIFPGFQLDGEIYSGILSKNRRAWYNQAGAALHLTLAPVLSYTEDPSTSAITKLKSLVSKVDAYAMYRLLILPHRTLSPSLTLQVGLSRFAFPLKGAQFPGVAFMAPHIGLDAQMPVHRALVLHAGGGLRPAPSPSDGAGTLLGKKSGGLGWVVGGGLKGSWRLFEAGLRVQYERMAMSYTGTTSLTGTPTTTTSTTPVQFTNIKLTDGLLQILLTAGVAY